MSDRLAKIELDIQRNHNRIRSSVPAPEDVYWLLEEVKRQRLRHPFNFCSYDGTPLYESVRPDGKGTYFRCTSEPCHVYSVEQCRETTGVTSR